MRQGDVAKHPRPMPGAGSSKAIEGPPPAAGRDGTLTHGNTSAMHDGAGIVVVVSESVWIELGKPRALRLVASVIEGVAPENEAGAPMEALVAVLRLNEGLLGSRCLVGFTW